jgi:pantetheine-phosphate adenylyltransferase
MKKVIYPGTFDPITKGHQDIILRAAKVFDVVTVAVAIDTSKKTFFSVKDRVSMVRESVPALSNIKVCAFRGLLMDFVKKEQANIILRGLRAVSDFEYEFQLASMNRQLYPQVETMFLTPGEKYAYISSSMVREIVLLGGDVAPFVSTAVEKKLKNILKKKR